MAKITIQKVAKIKAGYLSRLLCVISLLVKNQIDFEMSFELVCERI